MLIRLLLLPFHALAVTNNEHFKVVDGSCFERDDAPHGFASWADLYLLIADVNASLRVAGQPSGGGLRIEGRADPSAARRLKRFAQGDGQCDDDRPAAAAASAMPPCYAGCASVPLALAALTGEAVFLDEVLLLKLPAWNELLYSPWPVFHLGLKAQLRVIEHARAAREMKVRVRLLREANRLRNFTGWRPSRARPLPVLQDSLAAYVDRCFADPHKTFGHRLQRRTSGEESSSTKSYTARVADWLLAFTSLFRRRPGVSAQSSDSADQWLGFPYFDVHALYRFLFRDLCAEFLFIYALLQLGFSTEDSFITPGFAIRWVHRLLSFPLLTEWDGYHSATDAVLDDAGAPVDLTELVAVGDEWGQRRAGTDASAELSEALAWVRIKRAMGTGRWTMSRGPAPALNLFLSYHLSPEIWFWLARVVEKDFRSKAEGLDVRALVEARARGRGGPPAAAAPMPPPRPTTSAGAAVAATAPLQQDFLEEQASAPEKSRLLQLLQGLHRLCEAFGFPYLAAQGTLLGAIRHHELIPWTGDAEFSLDVSYFPFVLNVGLLQSSCFFRQPEPAPDRHALGAPPSAHARIWRWVRADAVSRSGLRVARELFVGQRQVLLMYAARPLALKFFFDDGSSPRVPGHWYRYPYLDLVPNFVDERRQQVGLTSFTYGYRFPLEWAYPRRRGWLHGLPVWLWAQGARVLLASYAGYQGGPHPLRVCKGHHLLHRGGLAHQEQRATNCSEVRGLATASRFRAPLIPPPRLLALVTGHLSRRAGQDSDLEGSQPESQQREGPGPDPRQPEFRFSHCDTVEADGRLVLQRCAFTAPGRVARPERRLELHGAGDERVCVVKVESARAQARLGVLGRASEVAFSDDGALAAAVEDCTPTPPPDAA